MLKLYFLRHGQTQFNLEGIVQGGGIDSDLNETGRLQGERFFNLYEKEGFDGLVCSGLKRTYQTIQPFIEREDAPLLRLDELNELSWGVLEGQKAGPEMHRRYLDLNHRWSSGELHARIEEGESPLECWDRAELGIEKIRERFPNGKVLVCTHGRLLRIILAEMLGYGMQYMNLFPHENTALNVVHISRNGKSYAEKLNDLSHLN